MADTTNHPGCRVLVYGSLKAGHGNHPLLHGSTFLGRMALPGPYVMLDLGFYPGVVRKQGGDTATISAEVYQVSEETLYALDCLEGHPTYYKREKVETPWKKAWCYFLPESYLTKDIEVVEDGVWQPNEEEQAWLASK